MKRHSLHPKKSLGQHFLIDENIFSAIINAAELSSDDIVIEVGAGNGSLTGRLAQRAGTVLAVELDDRLVDLLKKQFIHITNVKIIAGDILQLETATLIDQYYRIRNSTGMAPRYKVVANLPYYITSPVLRHFLEPDSKPELMVITVQKEVGEAICAAPGKMSLLSAAVQFYGEPSIVTKVSASSFYPRPRVDSMVIKIKVYPRNVLGITDESNFFKAVRAGFTSPRKQLINSLASGLKLDTPKVRELLRLSKVEATRRAETLTLKEWATITETIKETGISGD